MDTQKLDQLLDLRSVADDVARGYLFEQALREFVPWDFRPPLAMRARGEQFDAFYEWNSWHFILEAKAKRKPIKRSSHDWEDFELKVRRRNGSCVGLFASLFEVADSVIEAAEDLNREGLPTIILAGEVWDHLRETWVPVTYLLRYLVLHAKAKHKPIPPNLQEVRRWCYDHDQLRTKIQLVCRSLSATFLRRHALPRHTQVYVSRDIDNAVAALSAQLRPSALSEERRTKTRTRQISDVKEIEYQTEREKPHQLCILRDASGSGKTTLSVQIAFCTEPYYGISRAASEDNIDDTFSALDQLGPQKGIHDLVELNKQFVCCIDSLDEAVNIPGKKSEVIGLVRALDDLNNDARKAGLLAYPLLLVFTIREDYWREWESVFEGVRAVHYRNHFSLFSPSEFVEALSRYSTAYQYIYLSEPSGDAAQALSLPFNLHVFSEANEFSDSVSFVDLFDERVLQLYFERKGENVVKRRVVGLSVETFTRIASEFAMSALRVRRQRLTRSDVSTILRESFPHLHSESDHVLLSFLSEGILARDPNNPSEFRFRHSRYMEYLTAQYIVRAVEEGRATVEDLIEEVFESGVVSMFRVHDFVRFICKHEFPHLYDVIMETYAQSDRYMAQKLPNLRVGIAHGHIPVEHDIALISKSLSTSVPEVAWDAFFTFAAKVTPVPEPLLFEAFEAAWKANADNPERWKIIDRMATRGYLLRGNVVERVLESPFEREWEYFLGSILSSPELRKKWEAQFQEAYPRVEQALGIRTGIQWQQVHNLWTILVERLEYVPGDV
jgi:hypothetical protein